MAKISSDQLCKNLSIIQYKFGQYTSTSLCKQYSHTCALVSKAQVRTRAFKLCPTPPLILSKGFFISATLYPSPPMCIPVPSAGGWSLPYVQEKDGPSRAWLIRRHMVLQSQLFMPCLQLPSRCWQCSCGYKETAALKRLMARRNNRFAASCWTQRNGLLVSKGRKKQDNTIFCGTFTLQNYKDFFLF